MYLQLMAVRVPFFQNSPCHGLSGRINFACAAGSGNWWMVFGRAWYRNWEKASWNWDCSEANWVSLLLEPHSAAQLTEGQPFYLHALAQSLRLMGNLDTRSD